MLDESHDHAHISIEEKFEQLEGEITEIILSDGKQKKFYQLAS